MFDNQPLKQSGNIPEQENTPQPPQLEDIFAEAEKSTDNRPAPVSNGSLNSAINQQEDIFGGRPLGKNKFLKIILVLLLVAVIVALAVWASKYIYDNFLKNSPSSVSNTNVVNENNVNNNSAVNISNSNNNQVVNTNQSETNQIVDTDGDGLSDEAEMRIGTDSNNFDTDFDGLNDGAEVNIYKTDPKNADTDSDGYKDGQEVVNGYDPLRPGSARLYEIPNNQ